MAHDPTYTNFQVARGSREDDNVYSNFCNHQRRSDIHRGKQGWTGEVSCGGWTFLCGKACIFYFILVISFLITLILLITCLVNISSLATNVRDTQEKLTQIKTTVSSLATNVRDTQEKLTQIKTTVSSLATNVNDTLEKLNQTQREVSSLATNVNDTLEKLNQTQREVLSLATNVNDTLKTLTKTQREGTDMHCFINGSSCGGRCCLLLKQLDGRKADKLCPSIEVRLVTNNKGKEQDCSETNTDNSNSIGTQYETTSVSGVTASSDDQHYSKVKNG
ncbi:uncharacterized protein LOC127584957 isoform X1 [Pristis pectinata]|uniref:uncharacterized protein LOC127584957 isoform X1 n=1 Tax=Pristis pectinata TaxID=685728 RepID=UPI00223D58D7|nr:uncharacterized protein LOC127584957 isoform X1 [Pristis pectinata]